MGINEPKPGEVRSWFEECVNEAMGRTQPMDQDVFDRRLRGCPHRDWMSLAPSLNAAGREAENRHIPAHWPYERKVLRINASAFLIRASAGVRILKHEPGQEVSIPMAIKSWAAPLAALVPAQATAQLLFKFNPEVDGSHYTLVDCMIVGVVDSTTAADG